MLAGINFLALLSLLLCQFLCQRKNSLSYQTPHNFFFSSEHSHLKSQREGNRIMDKRHMDGQFLKEEIQTNEHLRKNSISLVVKQENIYHLSNQKCVGQFSRKQVFLTLLVGVYFRTLYEGKLAIYYKKCYFPRSRDSTSRNFPKEKETSPKDKSSKKFIKANRSTYRYKFRTLYLQVIQW